MDKELSTGHRETPRSLGGKWQGAAFTAATNTRSDVSSAQQPSRGMPAPGRPGRAVLLSGRSRPGGLTCTRLTLCPNNLFFSSSYRHSLAKMYMATLISLPPEVEPAGLPLKLPCTWSSCVFFFSSTHLLWDPLWYREVVLTGQVCMSDCGGPHKPGLGPGPTSGAPWDVHPAPGVPHAVAEFGGEDLSDHSRYA